MSPSTPFDLGPIPESDTLVTLDERTVAAPVPAIFGIAADVERWPDHLPHYRYVRFRERRIDGGGVVEMAAKRPFGPVGWPTWWLSEMSVHPVRGPGREVPTIRFRHIGGITKRMEVEWSFTPVEQGTHVRIQHVWGGPRWPLVGRTAARTVIGPVFVHGIASRTLAGLAAAAER